MKPLRLDLKKACIITMFAITMSLVMGSFVYASSMDNERRSFGSSSSSMFGSSYVNRTMYETQSIINQATVKEDSQDEPDTAVNELQNKVGDDVKKGADAKVTTELKKKSGASNNETKTLAASNAGVNTIVVTPAANLNPADIPAYVRDSVQKYIMDQPNNANQIRDYQLKCSNGNYYAVWNEIDSDHNNVVKAQMFNSNCNPINTVPITLYQGDGSGVIDNVLTLSNGNVAVFWDQDYHDVGDGCYLTEGAMLAPSDNTINVIPITLAPDGAGNGDKATILTLSNGNIAAFWGECSPDAASPSFTTLKAKIIDPSGNAITITLPMTNNSGSIQNVSMLSNGNIAVFWTDSYWDELNTASGGYSYTLKAQTFDPTGKAINTPITLYQKNGSDNLNVTALPNGNMAVFWNVPDSENNSLVTGEIIDPNDYTKNTAPITLNTNNYGYISNVSILPNGNIAVSWGEFTRFMYSDYSLHAQIIDPSDYTKNTAPITLDQNMADSGIPHVSVLSNDDIAVFWNTNTTDGFGHKFQIIDPSDYTKNTPPITLIQNGYINDFLTLSNGNIAIFWCDYDSAGHPNKVQIIDPNDYTKSTAPITLSYGGTIENVSILSNGNIIVCCGIYGLTTAQIFDPTGKAINTPITLGQNDQYIQNIESVSTLSNGNIVVFFNAWNPASISCYSLAAQILDPSGNAVSASVTLSQNGGAIKNFSELTNGDIAVFWKEYDSNGNFSLQSHVIDSQGNSVLTDILNPYSQGTSLGDRGVLNNPYITPITEDPLSNLYYNASQVASSFGYENLAGIFRTLLTNKDNLAGTAGPVDNTMVGRVFTGALGESALSMPLTLTADQGTREMEIAMKLSNIMKNPTEEQKLILDTVQSLVSDMNDIGISQDNKELQAAADKIIEIAANYLLNQALPDLIKAGDMAGVKGIFQELDNTKTKIMLEYQTNTAPYYAELKKMIQNNAKGLTSILGKTLTQEELDKLPPQKINEILDMIKRDLNKTSYENDILDYKKKYIEPSKKLMEEKMKEMLERFAKQLSAALEVEKK